MVASIAMLYPPWGYIYWAAVTAILKNLTDLAWSLFGSIQSGWQRVQAAFDDVHDRLQLGSHHARRDRTAAQGYEERIGVCCDFTH